MRIGSFLLTGILLLGGSVLSVTWVSEPDVSTLTPVSVRVSSVPPKRNSSSRGGVYVGGSRGSGRYSSGGGFSSGK